MEKLDNDIKALYLSENHGKEKFTKIFSDFEELIDWKLIRTTIVCTRTVGDTNKNGEFDKKDAVINMICQKKGMKPIGYEPV
jgi:hypothetical protein